MPKFDTEPPSDDVRWALPIPVILLLAVLPLSCVLVSFCSGPVGPEYERHQSPDGTWDAITGVRQDAIDRFDWDEAVWIAPASERDEMKWHVLLPWAERVASVRWVAADHLIVESRPVRERTETWNGVTIEIRRTRDAPP